MNCTSCHIAPDLIGDRGHDHFVTVDGDPWCASCIARHVQMGTRDTSWLVGILVGLNRTQRFRGPRYWPVSTPDPH